MNSCRSPPCLASCAPAGGGRGREIRAGAQERQAAGAMRRWMYVYLAVDVWSYDLLHIALYPHNTTTAPELSAGAPAKGYHPQVIITDLRQTTAR